MSGHIISAEGKKVMAVGGQWNEYLDCQRCDEEGDPLPSAEKKRLWEASHPPFLPLSQTPFTLHVLSPHSKA